MHKSVSSLGLLFAGLLLTVSSISAQTIVIPSAPPQVTTPETLSSNHGSVTVNSGGILNVSGTNAAISFSDSHNNDSLSVTNNGTIEQTGSSYGLVDTNGHLTLTITNNAGATIKTTNADTINLNQKSNVATLNNYGTITSTNTSAGGNQAVDWNQLTGGTTSTINNFATGLIQASEADAVRPGVNGAVNNSGTILSTTSTGSSSDGIDAQTNSGITITNAAASTNGSGATNLIEGGRHGITGGNTSGTGVYAMTVTNNVGGTIQGDNGSGINIDGINGNELVTITNGGTITGNGHNISDGNAHDGDGVDVDGLVNLNNSGTIQSINAYTPTGLEFSEGVTVGGGSITNTGTIEGSVATGNTSAVGRGITLAGVDKDASDNAIPIQSVYTSTTYPGPTITNSGLIKGDTESGIAVLGTTGGGVTVTITNNAGGIIEGNNSGVSEDTLITSGPDAGQLNGESLNKGAIELDDTGNTYIITNSGKIQQDGASGVAVAMHGATNTLNITGTSAQVLGDIIGTGSSTVNIGTGSDNTTFGYKGTISGNTTLNVLSGSKFTVGGTQTGNTAAGLLTLNTTQFTSGTGTNTSADMNVTSANLTFALGASDSNTQIAFTGGVNTTLAFSLATVTINDLAGNGLDVGHEYTLIDGDGIHTSYTGLAFGGTNSYGQQIIGGLSLLNIAGSDFAQDYGNSQLYMNGDNIDLVIEAAPEPNAWMLALICGGVLVGLRLRRRQA